MSWDHPLIWLTFFFFLFLTMILVMLQILQLFSLRGIQILLLKSYKISHLKINSYKIIWQLLNTIQKITDLFISMLLMWH